MRDLGGCSRYQEEARTQALNFTTRTLTSALSVWKWSSLLEPHPLAPFYEACSYCGTAVPIVGQPAVGAPTPTNLLP